MKVVFVFPVDTMAGSGSRLPGLVFFDWRGLPVARQWVKPRNPQTGDQVSIRNILTQCSQGFQGITLVQKQNWADYATLKPTVWYGKEIVIPEISAYVKVNAYRRIDNVALDNDAPTALADFVATGISNAAYATGTSTLSFDVTHNATVTTGRQWAIYITPSLPSAVYKVRTGDYRMCKGVDTGSIVALGASPQTVSIVNPKFGNWSNGDSMGIKLIPLSADYDPGTTYAEVETISVT